MELAHLSLCCVIDIYASYMLLLMISYISCPFVTKSNFSLCAPICEQVAHIIFYIDSALPIT